MPTEVKVSMLNVGHGDALLIQCDANGKPFTCLIDGGQSLERLLPRLEESGVQQIDRLILTHLDSDHVGGLNGLADKIAIGEYWGPCLPAFERYTWLFGKRGQDAIVRGRELESQLTATGTKIIYPLEGFQSGNPSDSGQFTLLSPAPKLISKLLIGDDGIEHILGSERLPLDWMNPRPVPEDWEAQSSKLSPEIEQGLRNGVLSPEILADLSLLSSERRNEIDAAVSNIRAEITTEPEFFGDSVLNNTSLVVYTEHMTGAQTHRALYAGDQEDWTYLFARHPMGLQADILKASHHGGSIWLDKKPAENEVMSAVQPKIVLFSANGNHGLPHTKTRTAAGRWGAFVMCNQRRGVEFLTGNHSTLPCCKDLHNCVDSGNSVVINLSATGASSNTPACHSGFGRGLGPVIQVEQHVISPSNIISRLTEGELLRHIDWVKTKLKLIHREKNEENAPTTNPVSERYLKQLALSERRFHLVSNLSEVLSQGHARGEFWASKPKAYNSDWTAYCFPSKTELNKYLQEFDRSLLIIFEFPNDIKETDIHTLMAHLNPDGLALSCEKKYFYPSEIYSDAFWPHVSKKLRLSPWHCFKHRKDLIGFAKERSMPDAIQVILRKYSENGKANPNTATNFAKPEANDVVVNPLKKSNSYYSDSGLLERWLKISDYIDIPRDLSDDQAISHYANRFSDTYYIKQIW